MFKKLNKIDIVELLILIMPLIDIFNTISGVSISLVYRGLFLAFLLFIFLFKNKSKLKKVSLVLLFLLFCFAGVFLFNFYSINGTANLVKEVVTLIKFLYLPIATICLVNYYSDKDFKISEIMLKLVWIYTIFLIVPTIFGIGTNSYEYGKKGFTGLFYAPNEIGAILAILAPFAVYNVQKKEHKAFSIILCLLFIVASFMLGTKTPVIGLIIALLHVLIVSIIRQIINKGNGWNIIINICLIAFSMLIYHNSYLVYNMNYQNDVYEYNNAENDINNKDNLNFYDEDKLYEKDYLINFPLVNNENDLKEVDNKFLNLIFSSRNIYMSKSLNAYKNSSSIKKLIGLSLYGESSKERGKLVELDFIDILVIYGLVGVLLLLVYLCVIAVLVFFKFMKKFKENIVDDEFCSVYLSFLIAFLIALLAGHTLGAPAVSIMVALTLTYLIKKFNLLKDNKLFNILAVTVGSLYVIFIITYLLLPIEKTTVNITLDNGIHVANEVSLEEEEMITYNDITDKLYYYKVNDYDHFKIIYVERTFADGDKIDYFTFNNNEDKNIIVNISYNIPYSKYLKSVNGLIVEGDKKYLFSNSYHYNNVSDTITAFNQNVIKNLLNEQYDYSRTGNLIKKSFSVKSNTSVDSYLITSSEEVINQNELIPWLSYNGRYDKINNLYGRNFEEVNLSYPLDNFNNILKDNYLMSLYNYTNNYNIFWYKDYEVNKKSNTNHNNLYLNLGFNYRIYKNLKLINNDDTYYQKFSDIIINEYSNNNYLKTNEGVMFNSLEYTFDNQISILNILLEYYKEHKSANLKVIIDKLLNELINDKWLIGDKDIHSYVTSDLNYEGTIKDFTVINDLILLNNNLKHLSLNKKEIDNYIKVLYNKFQDTLSEDVISNLKNYNYIS